MTFGLIVLFVVAGLIYFGVAHRVLDRMRLTDTQALIVIGLIVAGSFVEFPLVAGTVDLGVNVGGALIPVAVAIYLLVRAGTGWERGRALLAAAGTAGAIWGLARLTDFGPHGARAPIIDPVWLLAIIGGIIAYLLGRSRRAAFVAGTLGVVGFSLIEALVAWNQALPTQIIIGGGGLFDGVVLAGVISVSLAEVVGETRERLQGGPDTGDHRPEPLMEALTQDDGEDGDGAGSEERDPEASARAKVPDEAADEVPGDTDHDTEDEARRNPGKNPGGEGDA